MHARVTELHLQPDRRAQALAFIDSEIVPTYRRLRGFRGALWLRDDVRQLILAVNLWATWDDMDRSHPARFGWVERMQRYLTTPPQIDPFQIRTEDRLVGSLDDGALHARAHLARFQPGCLEEGVRLMRDRLIIPARIQQDYLGRLLLASPELQRAIAITFWSSTAAAGGSGDPDETSPDARRLGELLAVPLDVARYGVTVQD
jgi:hypothetical protein